MADLEKEIWVAVLFGRAADLTRLLAGDVDPVFLRYEQMYSTYGPVTALMLASYKGETAMVEMLVKAGADIEQRGPQDGKSALMFATEGRHTATVQALLQLRAQVNSVDKNGATPLIEAAHDGNFENVQLLLDWGADKNMRDQFGNTAADCAKTEEIMNLIDSHEFSGLFPAIPPAPLVTTSSMVTAADQATSVTVGQLDSVLGEVIWKAVMVGDKTHLHELLKRVKAEDLQYCAKDGIFVVTALMGASSKGYAEMVEMLVQAGADVNQQDPTDGNTALMHASSAGHSNAAQILLRSGANVNAQKKGGATALMLAARNGHLETVQLLLDWGADKNLRSEYSRKTAADVARTEEIKTVISTHVLHEMTEGDSAKAAATSLTDPILASTTSTATTLPAEFTEQDYRALVLFQQSAPRLEQALLTVAAHDRALQVLVSKEKECPSLFWFYPKKPELRRWMSDPAKCLFQDSLMMVVVCPVTLCVVPCGPDGVGWEVSKPKKWVKEWGPAILFSIYVLQAAVVVGRVVGIPIPPVPGASEVKEALGLKGMLGGVVQRGANEVNLSDTLHALADVTTSELVLDPEMQTLCDGLRIPQADQALPAHLPMRLVGDAYKSIHTFLTTEENAKLGKLEDQLKGRMERVMSPDGDIEWVSVEGKSAWLQKHSAVVSSMPQSLLTLKSAAAGERHPTAATGTGHATGSSASASDSADGRSWLSIRLMSRGLNDQKLLARLDEILVSQSGEGFTTEDSFAKLPANELHHGYLRDLGITAKGTATHLLELHRELHAQYRAVTTSPGADGETAALTVSERVALLETQKVVQSMQQELDKLRKTSTAAAATQKAASGLGSKGGLIQQQVQSNIRNPRTNQPYTVDELVAEIQRLQQHVAAVDGKVVGVAAAAEERLSELVHFEQQLHPHPPVTQTGYEVGKSKKGTLGGWRKLW